MRGKGDNELEQGNHLVQYHPSLTHHIQYLWVDNGYGCFRSAYRRPSSVYILNVRAEVCCSTSHLYSWRGSVVGFSWWWGPEGGRRRRTSTGDRTSDRRMITSLESRCRWNGTTWTSTHKCYSTTRYVLLVEISERTSSPLFDDCKCV